MGEPGSGELVELRERVRVLSAGLGLEDSFRVSDEVRRLVDSGETVQAVKALRKEAPGRLSLVAAKRMVDAVHRSENVDADEGPRAKR